MTPGQETPYQIALRTNPPIPNGSQVRFRSQMPGNTGEVIGHGGVYQNNTLQYWVYIIVPYGMRDGTRIVFTRDVNGPDVERI